jgi:hypothetical protein
VVEAPLELVELLKVALEEVIAEAELVTTVGLEITVTVTLSLAELPDPEQVKL